MEVEVLNYLKNNNQNTIVSSLSDNSSSQNEAKSNENKINLLT